MEHFEKVAVVPFRGAWSDVGSWNAVAKLSPADGFGNRICGQGVISHACNTYINAPHRPVVALGTSDLIIVDTPDAVLVASSDRVEQVKDVVAQLRKDGVSQAVMPTNLYGPGDNYHPENSHVIPALIRRFHEAKKGNYPEVVIWGTGTPMREFLYVDDMASASIFVMNLDKKIYTQHTEPMQSHINVGFGSDVSIKELAEIIGCVVGYQGKIIFDISKPDGTPMKLMNSRRLESMGWKANVQLMDGLKIAYADFLNQSSL
jgi:hypothetical protein